MPSNKQVIVHPTPEGAAVTRLILSIFRTNGRLLRAGDTLNRDIGLTAARWQVLGAIEKAPKTVAQIARDYELSRQGILWIVKEMVKDGTVELVRNPDHRRAKLVRCTAKGHAIYAEVAHRQRVWSNGLAGNFSIEELDAALDVVNRLSAAVKEPESDEE